MNIINQYNYYQILPTSGDLNIFSFLEIFHFKQRQIHPPISVFDFLLNNFDSATAFVYPNIKTYLHKRNAYFQFIIEKERHKKRVQQNKSISLKGNGFYLVCGICINHRPPLPSSIFFFSIMHTNV